MRAFHTGRNNTEAPSFPWGSPASAVQSPATITYKEPNRASTRAVRRWASAHSCLPFMLTSDLDVLEVSSDWSNLSHVPGTLAGRKSEDEGISGFCLAWEGG